MTVQQAGVIVGPAGRGLPHRRRRAAVHLRDRRVRIPRRAGPAPRAAAAAPRWRSGAGAARRRRPRGRRGLRVPAHPAGAADDLRGRRDRHVLRLAAGRHPASWPRPPSPIPPTRSAGSRPGSRSARCSWAWSPAGSPGSTGRAPAVLVAICVWGVASRCSGCPARALAGGLLAGRRRRGRPGQRRAAHVDAADGGARRHARAHAGRVHRRRRRRPPAGRPARRGHGRAFGVAGHHGLRRGSRSWSGWRSSPSPSPPSAASGPRRAATGRRLPHVRLEAPAGRGDAPRATVRSVTRAS